MNHSVTPKGHLIHYESCPACGDAQIAYKLAAKDYTVSEELFEIYECNNCTLRFTQDVPDQQGIGAYYKSENYISHTETKQGLVNSLYHKVRKRTLSVKHGLLEKYTRESGKSLLDIGAGTGAFASYMQKHHWQVTAVEPDETARAAAQTTYGLQPETAEALFGMKPATFSAITMWHVLEHVHELHRYLERVRELLRENGRAFIAVPNYTSYDANHYRQFWAAYDVPRHLYHFSPASMKILLEKHGLLLAAKVPMWYDSFYVSMLSEQYKNGSTNYVAAINTGIRSNIKGISEKDKCSSLIYVIRKKN